MVTRDKKSELRVCESTTVIAIDELCRTCNIERSVVVSMLEHGIIASSDGDGFDISALARVRKAVRFHKDLQVNVQGVAIILDLLDELDAMRARLAALERTHGGG